MVFFMAIAVVACIKHTLTSSYMYTHTYIRTHTSEVFRFIVFASVFLLRMQNAVQKESETFDVCVAAVGSAAAALL